MGNIKIVEYENKYASSLAEMWNVSGDNWGGYDMAKTEEDIIKEVEDSSDLKLYLAVEDEKVLGSCSYSEYKYDENTSYIPLLNVRPDSHGKKLGKKLVMKVVETAIKSKWPRLDLFTWPGNTKAVPLYKKCGFFWENREETTHLMNFIPYVLQTEAVSHLFEDKLHWYESGTREIKVEKDGIKDGEFEFYEYSWSGEDANLRLQFERFGRGLTLIETDDYCIRTFMKDQKLVFGKEYDVFYEIVNKSGKELNVEIQGENHKNVEFDYSNSIQVKGEETLRASFYLNKIEKEQSIWKTHPSVSSKIKINGKSAVFGLGVQPKFPINIKMIEDRELIDEGMKGYVYLNLENNFKGDIQVKFSMPENEQVEFVNKDVSLYLKEKEKRSIEIEYTKKKHGYFIKELDIQVKNGEQSIEFSRKITHAFKGKMGKFYGESEDAYEIFNGGNSAKLEKLENEMGIMDCSNLIQDDYMLTPKLGKPFSIEFVKKSPESVSYKIEDNYVEMVVQFKSGDFEGITLNWITRVFNDGITESFYKITTDRSQNKEITVVLDTFFNMGNGYLPMDGKIVKLDDMFNANIENWKIEDLDERWLFVKSENQTKGVIWGEGLDISGKDWHIEGHYSLETMNVGVEYTTPSVFYMRNSIKTVEEFREFAQKSPIKTHRKIVEPTEIEVNGGNPFAEDKVEVSLIQHKNVVSNGTLTVENKGEKSIEEKVELSCGDRLKFETNVADVTNVLEVEGEFQYNFINSKKMIFKKSDEDIKMNKVIESDMEVFEIHNGEISFASSTDYAFGLISLKHKGEEWLDNTFPKLEPKGWFNPYVGGKKIALNKISMDSLLKEKRTAEFVEVKDNFNNRWQGIKNKVKIIEKEEYKGLTIEQYFLTLQGVPVMASVYKITNETGKYISDEEFIESTFLNIREGDKEGTIIVKDKHGIKRKYKTGSMTAELEPVGGLAVGAAHKTGMLNIFTCYKERHCIEFEKDFVGSYTPLNLNLKDKEVIELVTDFCVLHDSFIERDVLKNLENVKFDI